MKTQCLKKLDFGKIGFRSVIKLVLHTTIKNCISKFKIGRSVVKGDYRFGIPLSITTPGHIDFIHDMIVDDRRIVLKCIK